MNDSIFGRRGARARAARVSLLAIASGLAATTFGARPAHALVMHNSTVPWPGGTVPVCFAPELVAQPRFDQFAQITRTNIENTWGRVANLRFTGWGTCPNPWPSGTVVLYYKVGGFNAEMLGYSSAGPSRISVDFNYNVPGNDNSQPARWASIVVHEFGHILGFEHEMDRDDNPFFNGNPTHDACTPDGTMVSAYGFSVPTWAPFPDEKKLTPYDANSIMAYDTVKGRPGCGIGWNGYAPNSGLGWLQPISPWDIEGVRNVYGHKPSGALVGTYGRCVTVTNGSLAMGTFLSASDCAGAPEQTWRRSQDGVNETMSAILFDYHTWQIAQDCMDVPNAYAPPNYTPLWDYACNNSVAQQIDLKGMQWKGIGDECIAVPSASTGAALQLADCSASSGLQRWDFEPTGRVRLSGTGLCVNVPWASAFAGNVLQLYPCGSPKPYPNEVYQFTDAGEVRWGGQCFNVLGGNPTPGSAIGLWPCNDASPSYNELFHMTGAAQVEGHCVEHFDWYNAANGSPIGIDVCNPGLPEQELDYYFALDSSRPVYAP